MTLSDFPLARIAEDERLADVVPVEARGEVMSEQTAENGGVRMEVDQQTWRDEASGPGGRFYRHPTYPEGHMLSRVASGHRGRCECGVRFREPTAEACQAAWQGHIANVSNSPARTEADDV